MKTQRLLAALDADDNKLAANAIKLLLLTGARRNEITHAKWDYIDWQRRTLLVPLAKSGKPRTIALNGASISLLKSLPRINGNQYIFPSPITGRPFGSLFYTWDRIRSPRVSPICGCMTCATRSPASWLTRACRSMWCKDCWAIRKCASSTLCASGAANFAGRGRSRCRCDRR